MVAGKILEVGDELTLSGKHMNHYFKNRNWQVECVALKDRDFADLPEWLPYVQEGALLLKVPPEVSSPIIAHFQQVPTHVRWLQVADALVRENNQWWPRLFLHDTLRGLVIGKFRDLDVSMDSYVIGANHAGRAAVAAMVELGFSRVGLVDEDEEKLAQETALLSRYLFGVDIEAIPAHTLTVREKPGTLMVNTLMLTESSAILGDLSYFNFMKTGGVVVDLSECVIHNQLLEEAQRADLKVMSGLEVQAYRDVDMLRKLFPKEYVTYEDYFESFSDILPSLKNPSSV